MQKITIGRPEFQDKVFGCWLGKNIGGTLGAPHEWKRYMLALDFYDPLPSQAAANDDLDLQLVWLQMLEETSLDPALPVFAEYWKRHASSYPWNEYGFFMRNYDRGLRPPVAGCFENYFVDEMGSPIRSEIWACLHAGDPQAAARMAWKDSALDHSGGEGTYGEMFWSAVQAAAFVESDPLTLIQLGLNMIPLSSHIARSIREALWCHQNHVAFGEARERIASRFGHIQACNAVPNHGFTILGWLYGKDFGDRLCKAVNCGFDTDCTGATLGATLGILDGGKAIPARWLEPIGLDIVLCKFTRFLKAPRNIQELTERMIALCEKAAAGSTERAFGARTQLPADLRSRLFRNEIARAALQQDNLAAVELCGSDEVTLGYNGEPVLRPGIAREIHVHVNGREQNVGLQVPTGWECQSLRPGIFRISSAGPVADRNTLTVQLSKGKSVAFTMLGPGEAKGFPAGANVAQCPKCSARVEACICQ